MLKTIPTILLGLTLMGCSAVKTPIDDDYEFGDTYESVHTLRVSYCESTSEPQKMLYQNILRSIYGAYPSEGVCSDLLDLVQDVEK